MNNNCFVDEIKKEIAGKYSLVELEKAVLSVLKRCAKDKIGIGYVAGLITSEGSKRIGENVVKLINATSKTRIENKDMLVFSSTDIFNEKLVRSLVEYKTDRLTLDSRFHTFWQNILSSGYVTDIFMTPGWERSKGARYEYKVAKKKELKIHIVDY